MKFMNPEVVFDGIIQVDGAITAANHAVTKSYLESNSVVRIAADSANYAEVITEDGKKSLKIKPLQITDVKVDTSSASFAAFLSANYSGSEKQEGDIVILTGTSATRPLSFIHNGGSAGTAADWTEIEGGDVEAAEVRGFLSGSAGINYNAGTGAITADQGEIRGFFSAGTGLAYSGGAFSLSADTDDVAEGSNKYFTEGRARASVSTSGAGLSYNAGTGVLQLTAQTGDIAESGSNQYFTQARARAAVSADDGGLLSYNSGTGVFNLTSANVRAQVGVTGAGLSYNSGTGEVSLTAQTGDIAESGSNQYFTQARARGSISVSGAGLSYNSGTGAVSLTAQTGDIAESGGNEYFTQARARASVQANAGADNLLEYANGSGDLKVSLNKLRKEFNSSSLTANTFSVLNHGLGKKLVHVSAMDASGNLVQLEVQYQDNNNVKVKASSNVSVDIAVSL